MTAELTAQAIPHNSDAEEALLGAVLINPDALASLTITPEMFYVHRHQWIWEAMLNLHRRGEVIDFVTLPDELEKGGRLAEAGGDAFLASLTFDVPSSLHAESYAEIVRATYQQRQVLQAAYDMAKAAYVSIEAAQQAVDKAVKVVSKGSNLTTHHISNSVDRVIALADARRSHPEARYGVPYGYVDLDAYLGPQQPGEAFLLAGSPGRGKSRLAWNIAINRAKAGIPGVIYSLEMGAIQSTMRAVTMLAEVPTRAVRTGKWRSQDEYEKFLAASIDLANMPLYLCDRAGITSFDLQADLTKLVNDHRIEWVLIDYMKLMSTPGNNSETERLNELSRHITSVTRNLGLAAMIIASFNKTGFVAKEEPDPRDVGLPAGAQHDASYVAILTEHLPEQGEKKNDNIITLTFKKIREGDMGLRKMHFLTRQNKNGEALPGLYPVETRRV